MKKESVNNPRFPHYLKIYREVVDDVTADEESEEVVLYEGKSRNFFNTTTDGDKKVVTNMRKSAIPVVNEDISNVILAGDIVEARKCKDNEIIEKGFVTDFKPANFGTEIFWKYVRN